MRKQRGITLMGTIVTLAVLGFLGIMAAKLLPAYLEYASVKKIFKTMVQGGQTKGTVLDIRRSYEKLNAIEDVRSVRGDDLEISKVGNDAVISAAWSVKVPLVANVSACIDFEASTESSQ
jgi:Tfp pilus assembly protein PilE